jgi:hypothetical protein
VSISARNSAQSPGALLDHRKEADAHIGRVQRCHAAELLHLRVLLCDKRVHRVIDRNNPDDVFGVVYDRDGEKVVSRDQANRLVERRVRLDSQRLPRRSRVHHLHLRIGSYQATQRRGANQRARPGIENKNGIDRLAGQFDSLNVLQRLSHRPVARNRDELGRHDPASTVRRKGQQPVKRRLRLGGDESEKLVANGYAQLADNVRSPVGGYRVEQMRGLFGRQFG